MAMRAVLSLTALSLLGSACSSDNSSAPATGGSSGTPGQAGTTATGGSSGNAGAVSSGGTSAQGGTTSTGGTSQSATGGAKSTGGTSAGSGGASAGGTAGSGTGGGGGGVAGASGSGGRGGAGGMSGAGAGGSSAGSGGGGAGGATKSAGCGQAPTLKNGTINLTFNNASRKYILRIPDGYDNNQPYRLVVAYAESGASAQSVADRSYFRFANFDSKSTIFVAPDAANGKGSWSKTDVEFTDAILEELEADLCIDKTRIFATGFSFGGAMSLAVACQRADVFRGVAFFSGADLTGSCTGTLTKPIAYYASQASGDSSGDPIPSSGRIKQAQFAEVNGCTAEPTATTFPAAGQPHKCTVYQGCSVGHPTVYCVFDGPHGWEPKDPGQSANWNPTEAWKFITQF